jgi:hypothetical protein
MMARYDRLLPLPLPERGAAFAGWPALRDLDGRERDAELARRLRLHFLVLRPIARRARERDTADLASLAAQVERVREELGALAARDPQRMVIAQALAGILDPSVEASAHAVLQLGERALEWGHFSAAQEYGELTAELAGAALPGVQAAAFGLAARAATFAGRGEEAEALADRALASAGAEGTLGVWADAVVNAAAIARSRAARSAATERLEVLEAQATTAGDAPVIAKAAEGAARLALAAGSPAAAAEHALRALNCAEPLRRRVRLAELVGDALLALGRPDQADRAFELAHAAAEGSERGRLLARRARARAEASDAEGFRDLVRRLPGTGLPAAARVELANGALAVGDVDAARRYASAAQHAARSALQRDTLNAAGVLLEQIERAAGHVVGVRVAAPSPSQSATDGIVEQLQALGALDTRP